MKKCLLLATVAVPLLLAGCGYGPKETVGTLGGAALGGWLGSMTGSPIGVGAGVFLGALVGNQIGRGLDDVDRMKAEQAQAAAQTAPVGQTVQWNNPNTGNHGTVTPTRDGYSQDGRYCREFRHKIYVGDKLEEGVGVACQNPDGSWQIMS